MAEIITPKNGDNILEPREYVLSGELRLRAGQSLVGVSGKTRIKGLTRLYIRDDAKPENLRVTGIIFDNVHIFMDHPNGMSEGVTIDNNDFVGANASIEFTSGLKNSKITNNTFRDTAGHPIYGYNYNGLTIANNELVNPGGGMHIDAQTASGALLVEQNVVDGSSGFGYEFQGNANGCIFQDNYFIRPRLKDAASSFGFSLILDKGSNIDIRRNTVEGVGAPGPNQIPRVAFEIGGDNCLAEHNSVKVAWDCFIDNDANGTTSAIVRNNRIVSAGKNPPVSLAFPATGRTLTQSGNGPSTVLPWDINRPKPGKNRRLDTSTTSGTIPTPPPTPPTVPSPTQAEVDALKTRVAVLSSNLNSAVTLAKQIVANASPALLAVLIFVGIMSGCAAKNAAGPITNAGNGVAAIVAHTVSAERSVQSAVPHSDGTGKTLLSVASAEHKAVVSEADRIRNELASATKQAETLRAESAKLKAKWFVVWGQRIERAFWIITIGWLVAGVASVALGISNPLGWGGMLGKELVRLIPAANAFAWLRDWFIKRASTR